MAQVLGVGGSTAGQVEAAQLLVLDRTPWRLALATMTVAAGAATYGTVLGQASWARLPAFVLTLMGIIWLLVGAMGLAPGVGGWLGARVAGVSAGLDIGLAAGTGWMLGVVAGPLTAPWRSEVGIAGLCVFVSAAAWRIHGAMTATRRLRAGIRGERDTIRALSRLPDTYAVLADLRLAAPDGYCELDAVVLGPAGVFVIETKRWGGDITPGPDTWTQAGRYGSVSHPSPLPHLRRGQWAVGRALCVDPEAVVPILSLAGGRLTQPAPVRVESPVSLVQAITGAPSRWPLAISPQDAAKALLAAAR